MALIVSRLIPVCKYIVCMLELDVFPYIMQVEERGVASDVDLRCPPGETLTQRKLATDVSAATDMSATFITFNTGDSSKYTVSGNTLRIINLQPQDEGLYRCTGPEAMTFCVLVISKLITKCILGFVCSPKSVQNNTLIYVL